MNKATRVHSVKMTVRGLVRYQCSHNEARLMNQGGGTQYDTILHKKRVHVFKEVTWLLGSEGKLSEFDLSPVSLEIPFRFWIPPSAPASMTAVWPTKKVNVHLGHRLVLAVLLFCSVFCFTILKATFGSSI
jgi:hypothetical protein